MKLEWRACLKIGGSVFLLYLCIHYWSVAAELIAALVSAAMPLIIGAMVAYLLNILMSAYERWFFPNSSGKAVRKLRRPVCLVGAILTLVAIVVLVVWLVLPQLVSCVQLILAEAPGFMRDLLARVEQWGVIPENIIDLLESIDWQSRISQIVSGVSDVVGVVFSAVSSVFSGIVTGLLAVIFSVYLLTGKERLKGQWDRVTARYLPQVWRDRLQYVLETLDDCFHKYIVGQCMEAVVLGVLCMIGMGILRLPYAPMVGALMAFTALIPVAGAWIGAGVGAFMILTVSPVQALVFLIFIVILQQLENNLIYPKVVGTSIGLPGIWVLAAVTVGGGLLGVGGMLLGVPITAAVYRIVGDDVRRKESKAKDAPAAEEQKEQEHE